jgi:pimeloyl-ACP methyl ester carboxylesterase
MRRFTANTERELGFSWQELELPEMAGRMKTPPPPVLVLHDRDDVETSWKEGVAIAQAWPRAQLHTTSGLGHRRILRDPAVIETVVEFLSRVAPASIRGGSSGAST